MLQSILGSKTAERTHVRILRFLSLWPLRVFDPRTLCSILKVRFFRDTLYKFVNAVIMLDFWSQVWLDRSAGCGWVDCPKEAQYLGGHDEAGWVGCCCQSSILIPFLLLFIFLSHLVGPLLWWLWWCTNSHDKKCNVGGTAVDEDNCTSQICLETWEREIKQFSIFKPPPITDWRGGWEVLQLVFHQHLLPWQHGGKTWWK